MPCACVLAGHALTTTEDGGAKHWLADTARGGEK